MKYYSAWDVDKKLYAATIDYYDGKYHVYFLQPDDETHYITFDNELDALQFALNWIGTRH